MVANDDDRKMSDTILAAIRYARGDGEKLLTEKPYMLAYPTPEGVPWTNFEISSYPGIKMHNLRKAKLDYHTSGIAMAELESCMPLEDFEDEHKIEHVYLPAIHRCIQHTLQGATEIYIFDYLLRKRNASFTPNRLYQDKYHQPALSAHIDYSPAEIDERLGIFFGERAEVLKKRHFQAVNVWKPLKGPLRDFPLAYCDASTVDVEKDLMVTDEVYPTMVNDIYQVLHNPAHKWYWIPDQTDTEVCLFAGYDSRQSPRLGVPHCAFDLAHLSGGDPRQSIEVRALVFFD